jgi:monofunctional biosynthetic peptidoglycan transglycosylase
MIKKISRIVLKVFLWFIGLSVITTLIYRFVPPPVTPLMLIRLVDQMVSGDELRLKKDWESLDNISPKLSQAVIAAEDQKFAEHHGFDFEAIEKAMKNNERKRKKVIKGGSTISQQTAKNVFLWPGRSWVRKGFEAYFTVLIELLWSKERIMEMYLNEIEMGNGIYGAEAASQFYFKKPASKLSASQAALIAACLPNPRRWTPVKPNGYIQRKQGWILRNMNNLGRVEY